MDWVCIHCCGAGPFSSVPGFGHGSWCKRCIFRRIFLQIFIYAPKQAVRNINVVQPGPVEDWKGNEKDLFKMSSLSLRFFTILGEEPSSNSVSARVSEPSWTFWGGSGNYFLEPAPVTAPMNILFFTSNVLSRITVSRVRVYIVPILFYLNKMSKEVMYLTIYTIFVNY